MYVCHISYTNKPWFTPKVTDFRSLVSTVKTWTLRVILQLNSPNQSRHKEWERKSAFALCMQKAAYTIGLTNYKIAAWTSKVTGSQTSHAICPPKWLCRYSGPVHMVQTIHE